MPDREKVIRGLEKLREYADSEVHPILSPDNWGIYCELRDLIDEAEEDALALLKAQETSAVHVTADINHRKIGECPTCGKWINSEDYPNYCGRCGQAVKWE